MSRIFGQIEIRLIAVDDWPVLRKVRLSSLEDAPYAFSTRLADWSGSNDTEERWRSRFDSVLHNAVAFIGDEPVGMVGALPAENGGCELVSMWVSAAARGIGVGDALIASVVDWARERGASHVSLEVRSFNARAKRLYERNGFVDVGVGPSTVEGSGIEERQMVLSLDTGTPGGGHTGAEMAPHTA